MKSDQESLCARSKRALAKWRHIRRRHKTQTHYKVQSTSIWAESLRGYRYLEIQRSAAKCHSQVIQKPNLWSKLTNPLAALVKSVLSVNWSVGTSSHPKPQTAIDPSLLARRTLTRSLPPNPTEAGLSMTTPSPSKPWDLTVGYSKKHPQQSIWFRKKLSLKT